MEANEKTFRHSPSKIIIAFFGILFLGLLAVFDQTNYVLLGIVGILLLIVFFYTAGSIKISNDEITTNRLLGSKSLRWSEIERVSTYGQTLRLHNYDDDLVLSLDSQLDGYTDLLDIIFNKRPDLLDKNETTGMVLNWLGAISTLGMGLFIMIMGIFQFLTIEDFNKIFSFIFAALGLSIIVKWLFFPKSLTLEGKDLILGYWFKEVSHSAHDIDFISLEKQRTRYGYVYSVQINLISGEKIKLPAFKPGVQLTYQILKRWHTKAVSN